VARSTASPGKSSAPHVVGAGRGAGIEFRAVGRPATLLRIPEADEQVTLILTVLKAAYVHGANILIVVAMAHAIDPPRHGFWLPINPIAVRWQPAVNIGRCDRGVAEGHIQLM